MVSTWIITAAVLALSVQGEAQDAPAPDLVVESAYGYLNGCQEKTGRLSGDSADAEIQTAITTCNDAVNNLTELAGLQLTAKQIFVVHISRFMVLSDLIGMGASYGADEKTMCDYAFLTQQSGRFIDPSLLTEDERAFMESELNASVEFLDFCDAEIWDEPVEE